MRAGREATIHHRWDDAVTAFNRAIDADETRAGAPYAEMGYAQLLAGQTDKALESLHEAEAWETSSKMRAQIFFNEGLAYDKKGLSEEARIAFARSNEAAPTTAAASKLGTQSRCPARITRYPILTSWPMEAGSDSFGSALVTSSWREVAHFTIFDCP